MAEGDLRHIPLKNETDESIFRIKTSTGSDWISPALKRSFEPGFLILMQLNSRQEDLEIDCLLKTQGALQTSKPVR